MNAITLIIPEARHALCTRHLEENARQILKDDHVTLGQRKDIVQKIFDKDGLINADDSVCFEECCDRLEGDLSQISSKFQTYFNKRLKTSIKDKVNDPVREGQITKQCTKCKILRNYLQVALL